MLYLMSTDFLDGEYSLRQLRILAQFLRILRWQEFSGSLSSVDLDQGEAAIFRDSLIARRGMPLEVHSDNATCFVRAAKDFVGPLGRRQKWRFIPPL